MKCEVFSENYCLTNLTGTNPFNLPSFNTNLGTLDCVDVRFAFDLNPVVSVFNNTTTTVGFTNASIEVPVDITGPGDLNLTTLLDGVVKSGKAAPGITNFTLPPQPDSGGEEIPTSDLTSFEGKPNQKISIDVLPSSPTFQGTAQDNGLFFGGSATEWGAITVQYCYTPKMTATPEPPGRYLAALVGCAMLVGIFGRRKLRGI